MEELACRGIQFRCLTQDIDTTTAGGRLVFTIFSAIAELEREIILERTRAGLDAARARGALRQTAAGVEGARSQGNPRAAA